MICESHIFFILFHFSFSLVFPFFPFPFTHSFFFFFFFPLSTFPLSAYASAHTSRLVFQFAGPVQYCVPYLLALVQLEYSTILYSVSTGYSTQEMLPQ